MTDALQVIPFAATRNNKLQQHTEISGQSRVRWWRTENIGPWFKSPKHTFCCVHYVSVWSLEAMVVILIMSNCCCSIKCCAWNLLYACFVFVLHNFPSVCECIPSCTNLALKGFSGTSCVSAATNLICLPPWPSRTRERARSFDGLLRRAYRSPWVCGSVSLCGWQAALYYTDWLWKCSSSHLAITTDTEMTVSSKGAGEVRRRSDSRGAKND